MKNLLIAALSATLSIATSAAESPASADLTATYPNCFDAPESVLLDLSAHDLLGSKEPADLLFAAAMAKSQRMPADPPERDKPCTARAGGVPESTSRYLLQLIDTFPGYKPGYPLAIAYCDSKPMTLAQCPQESRASCTTDDDKEATAALCGKDLARTWAEKDRGNGLAWRELAMQHYRQGEIAEAFTTLETALKASFFNAYSKEHLQAMWGSARRLYPQPTLDYLLQTDAPVGLPDMWGMSFGYDLAMFAGACQTESARDPRWLQLCLALTERIETESDQLLEAAVAGGIALDLLEASGQPAATERATQRKQAREELANCFTGRLDQSNVAELRQAVDLMARFGEIEAMRKICEAGLAAAHSSVGRGS